MNDSDSHSKFKCSQNKQFIKAIKINLDVHNSKRESELDLKV